MSQQQPETDRSTDGESFEAIVETDTLKAFLDVQLSLVDEAKWHIEDRGIRSRAVSASNHAMFETTLRDEAFESYAGTGLLGVPLTAVRDYVTSKVAGDLVHLSLDHETRKLAIDVGPTTYTTALISPESIRKEPDLPDLDLPASIGLDGALFKNALDAADMVSDHVRFCVDPDDETFAITAEGATDAVETVLGNDELLLANAGSEPVSSLYSLDYLRDMAKPIESDGVVNLELGGDFPVPFEYRLADEGVDVSMMLAPRIVNE